MAAHSFAIQKPRLLLAEDCHSYVFRQTSPARVVCCTSSRRVLPLSDASFNFASPLGFRRGFHVLRMNSLAGRSPFLGSCKRVSACNDGGRPVARPTDPEFSWIGPPSSEKLLCSLRWVFLLLYRALLVGGIGIGFSSHAPALAEPAASEVVVENVTTGDLHKDEGSTGSKVPVENVAEGNLHKDEGNLHNDEGSPTISENSATSEALGADFWNGIEVQDQSVERVLKDYLNTHPTNVPALGFLGQVLLAKHDLQNAIKVLDKVIQLDPADVEWKYMRTQAYSVTGELELAKAGYEEILEVQPFSTKALQGLAMVMDRMGDKSAGLDVIKTTFTKALQENKVDDARNLQILIAHLHTLKGHFQEALQLYKDMIDTDPADFRPYLYQGIIYSLLGEKDTAEQQFQIYRNLCPDDYPNRDVLDGFMSRLQQGSEILFSSKQDKSQNTAAGQEMKATDQ